MLSFLEAADRRRFQYGVACPVPSALAEVLAQLHVDTFAMPYGRPRRRLGLQMLSDGAQVLRASGRLTRLLRKFQPDLIDANTTVGALHAVLGSRGLKMPLVWHVRDLKPTGLVGRMISRRASAIVPVSHAVARTLQSAGIDGAKVHVIHNGIDAGTFRLALDEDEVRRKFNLPSDAILVGIVAQLTSWKSHDVLLRAWAQVRRRQSRAVLVIVGAAHWPEDRAWEEELKRLADELRLGGSVRFLARQEDTASIIGALAAVVIPSRAEPFGRVALEAMALGKAVVGTDAGGLPEVVADGVTGLLVEPGNARALAEAIERVLGDAQLAASLGQAGASRVREEFSIERTVALTEELYGSLLQGHGGR